jgi:PhnB protein
MTGKVKPIPDGHHSVTPYLTIKGAAKALEFYKKAAGAALVRPQGQVLWRPIGQPEGPVRP